MHAEIQAFLAARPDWSLKTQNAYQRGVEQLQIFLAKQGLDWKNALPNQLDGYRQSLLWQSKIRGGLYSPNTIDQALRAIRRFYRWASSNGLVATNPTIHWIFPRPPQPEQPILTREMLFRLLNLPNLARAQGQRDHLLIELLVAGLSLPECRQLDVDLRLRNDPLQLENSASESLARYLKSGRPQLLNTPTSALLLTSKGQRFQTDGGFRAILRTYQAALDSPHALSPRVLRNSYLDQIQQLRRKRNPLEPAP